MQHTALTSIWSVENSNGDTNSSSFYRRGVQLHCFVKQHVFLTFLFYLYEVTLLGRTSTEDSALSRTLETRSLGRNVCVPLNLTKLFICFYSSLNCSTRRIGCLNILNSWLVSDASVQQQHNNHHVVNQVAVNYKKSLRTLEKQLLKSWVCSQTLSFGNYKSVA